MLQWILENTLIAMVMAGGVCVACRWFRAKPAVCHFLWVLVLVRLVAPPISVTQWPPAPMRSHVSGWFDTQLSSLSTQASHLLSLSGGTPSADNRSVGLGSAAPVRPNPIEPALLPEEFGSPAEDAMTQVINDDGATNGDFTSGSAPIPAPSAELPSENVYSSNNINSSNTDKNSPTSDESNSPSSAVSSESTSEMQQSRAAWEAFFADKKAIRGVTPPYNLASATLNSALQLIGWTLAAIWLLGAIAALFIHGRRILRFHRAVRQAPMASSWLTGRVRNLADELHTPVPVVRLMPGLSSPVIWGFGRPTLLWPADDAALAQQDSERCDGIIVHELAHLVRRDHWLAWFEIMAISLLWWHPLAHLACRRLHEYADLACDSWVVSLLPTHRRMYAASIVDLIEQLSTAPRAALALGVGTSSRRALVERRLVMIVKERTTYRLSPIAAMLALATAAFLVPSWAGGAVEGFAPPTEVSLDSAIAPEHQTLIKQAILKRHADMFFQSKDWDSAAAAYESLLQADPENTQTAQRLSTSLVALGQLDRAEQIIRKSLDSGKQPALGHYNLACVLARKGDANGAFKELDNAIACGFSQLDLVNNDADLDPLRDDSRFRGFAGDTLLISSTLQQAQKAMGDEKWDDAVVHFGKLTKLAPRNGQAYHLLSYSSILASRNVDDAAKKANLDRAKTAEEKQIELNFMPGVARYNMACVDAIQGNVASGLKNLEASIELGFHDANLMSTDPDLDGLRSSSRFDKLIASIQKTSDKKAELEQAMEENDFAQALDLLANGDAEMDMSGSMAWSVGYGLYGDGQYADAEKAFALALKHGYDAGDTVYNLACCEALRGNTRAALGYLDAAVDAGYTSADHMRTDDDLESLHNEKRFDEIVNKAADASVLNNFGAVSWPQLLEKSQKAVAADSTNGKAYHHLGWALLRTDRPEEALAAFTRQREIGYAPAIAGYNIACCQAQLGHVDAALDVLAKLAKEDHGSSLNADLVANDPDLKSLHSNSRFDDIVKAFADHDEEMADKKAADMKDKEEESMVEVGGDKKKLSR